MAITITLTDDDALDYLAGRVSVAPNVSAAPSAPCTAVAAPLPIAPAETPDTSPDPAIAFARPVPSAPPAATTVAPPTAPLAPPAETPTSPPVIRAVVPELDSAGLPWDERIYSATRNRNKDGTWRVKRGVSDEVLAAVTAELKSAMAAPGIPLPPAATAVPPPPPAADPRQPEIKWPHHPDFVPPATATAAPVPPPPPTQPQVPPPPPPVAETPVASSSTITGFADLMTAILRAQAAGKITEAQVNEASTAVGMPSFPMLAARPDLIPRFASLLGL